MAIESIADRLNEFSIFGGIAEDALSEVADLFDSNTYAERDRIIDEGSRGHRLYIITQGRVAVSMQLGEADAPLELAVLGSGDTFGEMELIDTQQRSAAVVALEPTRTLELTNIALLRMFERDPDTFRMLMMNLARDLSRRLRAADQRLAVLASSGELQPARGHDAPDSEC